MSELFSYLPPYYEASAESRTIQDAFQPEINNIWAAWEELRAQLNPNTATWGLALWEEAFGVTVDDTKDLATRRAIVLGKIQGCGITTLDMLRTLASSITGTATDVTELPRQNWIKFSFDASQGRGTRLPDLIDALQEIMPAHLGYEIGLSRPETCALRVGGVMGRVAKAPVPQVADSFKFTSGFRVGSVMGRITKIPVPCKGDCVGFVDTLRVGGRMASLVRTPIPKRN